MEENPIVYLELEIDIRSNYSGFNCEWTTVDPRYCSSLFFSLSLSPHTVEGEVVKVITESSS